ncbi:MAG: hypothetical protein ABH874_03430 [Methanobacteriota archaeon]
MVFLLIFGARAEEIYGGKILAALYLVCGAFASLIYGFVFFALAAATGFLAHLVGLVLGFLIGYLITRDWYPEDEKESFWNNCRRV